MKNHALVFLLLLSLLPGLVAVLTDIGRPHATNHMEVMTLVTSQETWLRMLDGEKGAWKMPSWNGRPRIRKPPMSVWINITAWSLVPEATTTAELVKISRIVAALTALAALLSLAWPKSLSTRSTLPDALLISSTSFLFIRQARLASYDTFLMAGVAVGISALLSLLEQRQRKPGSQALLWVAGIAAPAFSVLMKGPVALILTGVPLIAMAIHRRCGWRRTGIVLGIPLLTAGIFFAVWYFYLRRAGGPVVATLLTEYRAHRTAFQPPWYYVSLIGLIFPWTLFLLNGLAAPFYRVHKERKQVCITAFIWFASTFIILSIPGAKQQRYIVPILPAAGLLAAAGWDLIRRERPERALSWCLAHWIFIGIASTLICFFVYMQEHIIAWGWIERREFGQQAVLWKHLLTGVLTAIWLTGIIYRRKKNGYGTPALTALWMALVMSYFYSGYADTESGRYRHYEDAIAIDARAGSNSLYYLQIDPDTDVEPDQKFLFYTRRVIEPLQPAQLEHSDGDRAYTYMIANDRKEHRDFMSGLGYHTIRAFQDGRKKRLLYEKVTE